MSSSSMCAHFPAICKAILSFSEQLRFLLQVFWKNDRTFSVCQHYPGCLTCCQHVECRSRMKGKSGAYCVSRRQRPRQFRDVALRWASAAQPGGPPRPVLAQPVDGKRFVSSSHVFHGPRRWRSGGTASISSLCRWCGSFLE